MCVSWFVKLLVLVVRLKKIIIESVFIMVNGRYRIWEYCGKYE